MTAGSNPYLEDPLDRETTRQKRQREPKPPRSKKVEKSMNLYPPTQIILFAGMGGGMCNPGKGVQVLVFSPQAGKRVRSQRRHASNRGVWRGEEGEGHTHARDHTRGQKYRRSSDSRGPKLQV